jgi:CO/xanthine dehydrogenase Mo-binding subunit
MTIVGNVATLMFGDKQANDSASRMKHVVSLRLRNNRLAANALETCAALGTYDAAGEATLYTTSQNRGGAFHARRRRVEGSRNQAAGSLA